MAQGLAFVHVYIREPRLSYLCLAYPVRQLVRGIGVGAGPGCSLCCSRCDINKSLQCALSVGRTDNETTDKSFHSRIVPRTRAHSTSFYACFELIR